MLRRINLISLLLISQFCFSQQYLNKTFTVNGGYQDPEAIIATDSGYFCSGTPGVTFFLLDSSANLKWVKQYSIGPAYMANIIETSDGDYLTGCTVQYGGIIEHLYMIKANSYFDTLYTKLLLTDSLNDAQVFFNYILNDENNDNIVIGSTFKDSSENYFDPLKSQGLLLKTDSNGNMINYKSYGMTSDFDSFNTGVQIGDYYYLFGATSSYSAGNVFNLDRQDGWVVKTDLEGNEIAEINIGNPNTADREFTYALKLSENRILTGRDFGVSEHASGIRMFRPYLCVIDTSLNIVNQAMFSATYTSGDTLFNSTFEKVVYDKDSCFLALGRFNSVNTSLFVGISSSAFVVSFDEHFNVRYIRQYVHDGFVMRNIYPKVITPTEDGGCLIGGYVMDEGLTPSQQGWLVKTDSLGCDGFNSCNDTALVCQIVSIPDTVCIDDTIWFPVRFKGRSAPYYIYSNGSLALDSIYYPYSLPLWIDTLISYAPTDTGLQKVALDVYDPWGWHASDTASTYVKNCLVDYSALKYNEGKIEIYPNPTTGILHVENNYNKSGSYTIQVFNSNCLQIRTYESYLKHFEISLEDLPKGVYTVQVIGYSFCQSKRVIKI